MFSFHLREGEITAESPRIGTSFTGKGGSARCLLCACVAQGSKRVLVEEFTRKCQDEEFLMVL